MLSPRLEFNNSSINSTSLGGLITQLYSTAILSFKSQVDNSTRLGRVVTSNYPN